MKYLYKSLRYVEYEKKMWSKSEYVLDVIWVLNGFFIDEWSEIRILFIFLLFCFEYVDISMFRSRCIINEVGLIWILVCEKNVCVRVVLYIYIFCVNVV